MALGGRRGALLRRPGAEHERDPGWPALLRGTAQRSSLGPCRASTMAGATRPNIATPTARRDRHPLPVR